MIPQSSDEFLLKSPNIKTQIWWFCTEKCWRSARRCTGHTAWGPKGRKYDVTQAPRSQGPEVECPRLNKNWTQISKQLITECHSILYTAWSLIRSWCISDISPPSRNESFCKIAWVTRVIRTLSTQARNHTYCQRRHETTLAAQTYTTSEEHIVANYQSELHIIVIFLPLSPSRYISHPGPQIRRDTKSTGPQTPAFAFDSYLALLCIISSILLLMSTFKQNSSMSSTIFRWGNSNFPVDQRIFRKCSVFCGDLL